MWFPEKSRRDWSAAVNHLCEASPALRKVIAHVGPCTLAPRKDYFVVLCKAIFTQQISTTVATVLFGRFRDLFPNRRPTPALVLKAINGDADGEALRRCGLSRQKRAYVKDLAEHFVTNQIPTRRLASMSDEEVIEALVKVKGIGRWTAEMFLIFTLNRPDVWPIDDLGLRKGAQLLFGQRNVPEGKRLIKLAEPLRPYRSIATWYLWRGSSQLAEVRSVECLRRSKSKPTRKPTRKQTRGAAHPRSL
ncbi:MAG: DNA-3-methyladenine glycosylase 2 family protein [Tepidisphaeraceae bacterium]